MGSGRGDGKGEEEAVSGFTFQAKDWNLYTSKVKHETWNGLQGF
jgi:hypothetical protein